MSEQPKKPKIKYGQALKATARWEKSVSDIKAHNIPVEKWTVNAIRDEHLCFMIPTLLNMKGQKQFNNRVYKDYKSLRAEYQSRKNINYAGAEENKTECRKLIADYCESGRLVKVSQQDRHLYTISPMNCIETKKNKFSLITHSLINSCYRKKDMNLLDITKHGEVLHEIDEFRTEDLHKQGLKITNKILVVLFQMCPYPVVQWWCANSRIG